MPMQAPVAVAEDEVVGTIDLAVLEEHDLAGPADRIGRRQVASRRIIGLQILGAVFADALQIIHRIAEVMAMNTGRIAAAGPASVIGLLAEADIAVPAELVVQLDELGLLSHGIAKDAHRRQRRTLGVDDVVALVGVGVTGQVPLTVPEVGRLGVSPAAAEDSAKAGDPGTGQRLAQNLRRRRGQQARHLVARQFSETVVMLLLAGPALLVPGPDERRRKVWVAASRSAPPPVSTD